MQLLSPFRSTPKQQNRLVAILVAFGVLSGIIDFVLTQGRATPIVTIPILIAAVVAAYLGWLVVEHRLAVPATASITKQPSSEWSSAAELIAEMIFLQPAAIAAVTVVMTISTTGVNDHQHTVANIISITDCAIPQG